MWQEMGMAAAAVVGVGMIVASCASCSNLRSSAAPHAAEDRELIDLTDRGDLSARRPLLIAHRGGVIARNAPECSLAAIRLAAAHGYDMVELDAQEAKDHEPVLFHDWDLLRACGLDKKICHLTSGQATAIRYRASNQRIVTLAQALSLCRSLKMGVMLDVKLSEEPPSERFFERIAELLVEHQLTRATMAFSGYPELSRYLAGKALLGVSGAELDKVRRGESVQLQGRCWFGLPEHLPSPVIRPLQRNGALVIPAINVFRYPPHAHRRLARRDVQRLLAAGVDGFQIDSVYEDLFERQ